MKFCRGCKEEKIESEFFLDRWATFTQQAVNRDKFTSDKNKYLPGARRHRDKWQSGIIFKNKRLYLGIFPTEMDAYITYLRKFKTLHGVVPKALNPKGLTI